jgi:hypothetical protein
MTGSLILNTRSEKMTSAKAALASFMGCSDISARSAAGPGQPCTHESVAPEAQAIL